MKPIDPKLLEILACPKCHARIQEAADGLHCTQATCGLVYPVRDGIPIMLIEEAIRPPVSRQPQSSTGNG
ncbi:MAG: hypothetical protein A2498_12335 [Lentisphaerae bacterium RIFOXYC12_FULL_60_16]|nr:MAG: hypothetical protein A2498_12335 [Lentisphaerae bacterium RIFOXYC12_FULL_60_16]OGV70188.1 MAG: hypothetical protein A2269_08895 [Lentisphaerae bacterium RIFOXYA12_FULL_60_10]OGV75230.1 MAG: hypothetical protein A2340_05940 [Lentisphaerae bacterium RIFOXYB12_FULL_60_10]